MRSSGRRLVALFVSVLLTASWAVAQAPAEVTNVVFTGTESLAWDPVTGSDHYNVYRDGGFGTVIIAFPTVTNAFDEVPSPGTYTYWVTAVDIGFNESVPSDSVSVVIF